MYVRKERFFKIRDFENKMFTLQCFVLKILKESKYKKKTTISIMSTAPK